MKHSEILEMLALTKSDDFVDAGEDKGVKTYEVIKALVAASDPRLMLRALQIAFALGMKAQAKLAVTGIERGDFAINEKISGAKYDELLTEDEKGKFIDAVVRSFRSKDENHA